MKVFGAVSYKKASIRDIAAGAGISKALIFHYFGTKKALYLYLIHYAFDQIKEAYAQGEDSTVMDFFDRVRLASDIKMSLIARHPALMQFSISAYYETDPEVAGELKELSAMGSSLRSGFVLSDVDRRNFFTQSPLNAETSTFRKYQRHSCQPSSSVFSTQLEHSCCSK